MSALRPFVFRLSTDDLERCRFQARADGKPLATWLRDVLAWYLTKGKRRARRQTVAMEDRYRIRVAPNYRLGIPKRLLDALGVQPGDELELTAAGGKLVLAPHRAPPAA
jgi:AbrB family looped-hinge helix DNA binding protein